MSSLRLPRPLLRRVLCTLLLALLWAQWSARVHAIEHGGGPLGPAGVVQAAPSPTTAITGTDHWGHGVGTAECRLFDQLLGGQVPAPAAATAPLSALADRLPWPRARVAPVAERAAWQQARAPPRA